MDRTAITGIVTDQQGNRVPAKVRATESATGFQRETCQTPEGTYELPGLPPGIYSVEFLKTGFAAFTAKEWNNWSGKRGRWMPGWKWRRAKSRQP